MTDTTAISTHQPAALAFSREQLDVLKQTVARDCTDTEFALFAEVCRTSGLNPFQRQIYALKRWSDGKMVMSIQTGIDGYRAVAARTGQHLGTTDAVYDSEDGDYPRWARVTVYRLVAGHRCEFTATARWVEYRQTKKDGSLSGLWAKMPYLMLAKCAEALALRKAFPVELSGVYTTEEMMQATPAEPELVEEPRRVVQHREPMRPEAVTADEFRAYWFARLAGAGITLTDDERHAAQLGMFGAASLADFDDDSRAKCRHRLAKTGDDRLREAVEHYARDGAAPTTPQEGK